MQQCEEWFQSSTYKEGVVLSRTISHSICFCSSVQFCRCPFPMEGYLCLVYFLRQVLELFLGSWFYAFLLFCFSVFLLFAFPASLLFCFCALPASFLFCFYAFPASLLFCLCASVPFYFYYSTFSFLQSCVFAALLPAPLLLCFLSLLPLVFFSLLLLYSLLFVNTLGKTQRNLKEILTRNPKWTLKKP